ncbi:BamA/TamA family outer membrane protein [Phormidium sp. CCY1219]|uniref:BamA/TamA family outer membrane protein n=1 Tax=Phormidium sp. CCY1219 TaxID=2886104 RepID=UPI002D1F11B3|nr:BamA/TamA family outer membrane protein [Phormidium sp. CCY1219]MEB3826074.1 BamA/TamA family outer membrane protein [Phormidium sp. CCY1219]
MNVRHTLYQTIPPLALSLGATSVTLVAGIDSAWGQMARFKPIPTQHRHSISQTQRESQSAAQPAIPSHSAADLNAPNLEIRSAPVGDAQPETDFDLTVGPGQNHDIFPSRIDTETEELEFTVIPLPQYNSEKGYYGTLDFVLSNIGDNKQILELDLEGGQQTLGAEFRYTDPWAENEPFDTGFQIRLFNTRWPEDVFTNGDREVELIHDQIPWVDRLGGGIELFQPVTATGLTISAGASYQRVAIRNAAVTDDVFSEDQFGNSLTFSDKGIDTLVTVNLSAFQDQRDDPWWPTQGYRFNVGTEQSIPVGSGDILFNRLTASFTQFVPVSSQTFVFNVQGGTTIGDLPPYEAFNLGGNDSVRGYEGGGVGSARSFVQATAEYRFPIIDDLQLPLVSRLGGTVFVDYASDLGSGDTVRGEPAEVRNKPGNGFGVGVGVRILTDFGPLRVEAAINDEQDIRGIFKLGERF